MNASSESIPKLKETNLINLHVIYIYYASLMLILGLDLTLWPDNDGLGTTGLGISGQGLITTIIIHVAVYFKNTLRNLF